MSAQDLVRRVALVLAICIGFSLGLPGEARAQKNNHHTRPHNHRKHYRPPVIKLDPSKFEEIKCLAMNAYFESDDNQDEMFESQFMAAYTAKHRAEIALTDEAQRLSFLIEQTKEAFERLRDRAVCMAVYRAWAFSWTMQSVCRWCQKWIRLQDVPEPHGYKWESAQYAAQLVYEGKKPHYINLDPEFDRVTYYFNPQLTKPKKQCERRQESVRLGKGERIGRHEFYAIPTPEEKVLLTKVHNAPPEKVPMGVTKKGVVVWKIIKHTCDPVDAITIEAKNP